MNFQACLTVGFFCLVLGGPAARAADGRPDHAPATADTNAPATRVRIKLKDGCVLVGQLPEPTLAFKSQIMGEMKIPLERLAAVEFSGEPVVARITLRNRDSMQANLVDKELRLKTVLGELKVPAGHLATMHVIGPP